MGLSALLSDNITQGSLDRWLIMLMQEKETANDMMGRYVDAVIEQTKLYNQALGDLVFAWGVASDDAGTQRSELLSPDLFAEMIKPHYKRLCDWVHANTNWKTYLHSCGSIYHFIPHWIEAGIDILDPIQWRCKSMDREELKKSFGDKVVFHGGVDNQYTLAFGSVDEVRQEVIDNIQILGKSGGYILGPCHNIQSISPPENIVEMYKAGLEYGWT